MKLGNHHLRAWREYRGLTQAELAAEMKVARATIGHLETGFRGYTEEILVGAARVLKCQPWEIIQRDPRKQPSPIWTIWERVPDAEKPHATAILQTFVKERAG